MKKPVQARAVSKARASEANVATRLSGQGGVLGRQIRDLRKAKGITLIDLAARIDRSLGWLSQIERGLSPVSISALDAIAQALGVQLSWFFAEGAPPDPDELGMVVRKRHRRVLDFYGSGVHEELLTPTFGNQLLLMETTFAPGASTGDRDRERRGDEAGVLLRGTLQLSVEGRTLTLKAGDSFAFKRQGPHCCYNPGRIPAVVLWVVTPPSY